MRHLATEGVTAILDRHVLLVVGESVDQHGHIQLGPAHGVGDGTLVAEIGQCDQHAVDLVAVGTKQVGAAACLFDTFDAAVARLLRSEGDHINAFIGQHLEHGLTTAVTKVGREEAAVADNHA